MFIFFSLLKADILNIAGIKIVKKGVKIEIIKLIKESFMT